MGLIQKPVALVTGASSGMGNDFALRLLDEGYVVYGAARRLMRMGNIEAAGGIAVLMDITNDSDLVACVDRIIRDHGRIDVLVNNAGFGEYGALEDVPLEVARRQLEVNLFGPARLTQLCLPYMRERRAGRIINVSSIGGKLALPLGGWYHASKFALEGYSDALRNEVRPFGIDVIVIEPGGIKSEWSTIALESAKRHSSGNAYSSLSKKLSNALANPTGQPGPEVITDLVVAALKAKRPKVRYSGGHMAKSLLFLKWCLPDRLFDWLIMSGLK